MKREDGLLASSASILVVQLLAYVCTFSTNVLVARQFGSAGKGHFSLIVLSGLLLYAFANMGLTLSFTYHVAVDRLAAREVMGQALSWGTLLGILSGILFLGVHDVWGTVLFGGISRDDARLIAASSPFFLVYIFQQNILLGCGNIAGYNAAKLLNPFLLLVLYLFGLLFTQSASLRTIPWFVAIVMSAVLVAAMNGEARQGFGRIWTPASRKHLNYGLRSYFGDLVNLFTYRLDFFVVNYFVGVTGVGVYSVAVALTETLWYIPNSVQTVLMPRVAAMSRRDAEALTLIVVRITAYTTMIISLAMVSIAHPLIPMVFGQEFRASFVPLLLLIPGVIALSVSKIVSGYLVGRGKPEYATYIAFATFGTAVILDLILIPRFGIAGASLASTASYILATLLTVYLFRRESGIGVAEILLPRRSDFNLLRDRLAVLRRHKGD